MKANNTNYANNCAGFPFDIFTIPTDQFYTSTKCFKNNSIKLSLYPTDSSTSDESNEEDRSTCSNSNFNTPQCSHSLRFTSFLRHDWCDSIKIAQMKTIFSFKYQVLCFNKAS